MNISLFGVNGIRGMVNADLTADTALKLGKAIGRSLSGTIAIARDARDSSYAVRSGIVAGLMAVGVEVIDLGVLPTPALQYFVSQHPMVNGGLMVTSSHGPSAYNGLKIILQGGVEASRDDEVELEGYYSREIKNNEAGTMGDIRSEVGAVEDYIQMIISHVDAEAIRKANLTVVLDCDNGSASITTPLLLEELGVRTIAVDCTPVGETQDFEFTKKGLSSLSEMAVFFHADLGVVHDCDGARAAFVDELGCFISGESFGSLIARIVLAKGGGKVVTPVSSSNVLEDVVNLNGGQVRYVAVGPHSVMSKVVETSAVLGVEEDGGMIFPEVQLCRDGGLALAKMLELIALNGPISEQIADLPTYYTEKRSIPCTSREQQLISDAFRTYASANDLRYDEIDGLKLYTDKGWFLVRPATTEPVYRIYADSKDPLAAAEMADAAEKIAKIAMDQA